MPYLESLLLGTIGAALGAQNAVVALESLGLGSVYIDAIRNDIEGVANELGLPWQVYPVFGLCVGYPSTERPVQVKPQPPQGAVLHHETYSAVADVDAVAEYDLRLGAFYQWDGMKASGWSSNWSIGFAASRTCMAGKSSSEQLTRMGFGLR
ncbi:nitroreductase family protein [Pseudomonas viridiflava]|uniref:nitroreductase family protein n=1 Tax=Pseudomonas viridiflava TaxID=33069 RepID=UPI002EA246DC|nr:nitroreductase family protein [Pseudomonas viridiflava]